MVLGFVMVFSAPSTSFPLLKVIDSILNLSPSIGGNMSKPKEELFPCTFTNHRLLPLFSVLTSTEKGTPAFLPVAVKHIPAPTVSNVSLITSGCKGSRANSFSSGFSVVSASKGLRAKSTSSVLLVVLFLGSSFSLMSGMFNLWSRTRPSSFPTLQWGA